MNARLLFVCADFPVLAAQGFKKTGFRETNQSRYLNDFFHITCLLKAIYKYFIFSLYRFFGDSRASPLLLTTLNPPLRAAPDWRFIIGITALIWPG
jgi:hypothetical protein